MPDIGSSTVVILLGAVVGLLFLILLKAIGIGSKLAKIEKLLEGRGGSKVPESSPAAPENLSGGIFDTFLAEDPSRKSMTKRDQAAAYRAWRQSKGMNWSNS